MFPWSIAAWERPLPRAGVDKGLTPAQSYIALQEGVVDEVMCYIALDKGHPNSLQILHKEY